ncbi:MAG: MXAN_5808 family serine peptidase [Myxococcota bacterium]|nr:MXAN_5808 family serine peptidase [Myxococcota bacterium]
MWLKYQKFWGIALVVIVGLIAAYVTYISPMRSGLDLASRQPDAFSSYTRGSAPSKMGSLKTLYRTINQVQKRYIDATRIDAKAMFVAAMRAVQVQVARVLVQTTEDQITIQVDNDERRLSLNDIVTPWILLQRIKEVFEYLSHRLVADNVDFQELEYVMINEMLRTLDPHSVFLNPDQYREMKDKTQGNFGGLGIVISIRDGALTVISPLDGTPAHRAGLQAGDQIVKIGDISTVNMALNDAVNLLRGEPGTSITVHILRKNWETSHPYEIERAIVKVESVESHMLPGRVGYVRIRDFQGNTPKDFQDQLATFDRRGIQGLVIDLRGCPGGLLEAAIRVSDYFIKTGVIVTTAGQGPTDRDVRRARESGEEPDYPIVVLVNRGSASASEIVAGALKNHGRAILVGERTFGKGSVQVLYDFQDGSALKLTTAQYLTPGDVSIQSVGVAPHIELLPMRADADVIDLQVHPGYRESDLDHHFIHVQPRQPNQAASQFRLSYLRTLAAPDRPEPQKPTDGNPDPPEVKPQDSTFKPDFEISFARQLVTRMALHQGKEVDPTALASLVQEKSRREDQKLVAALAALDIDWQKKEATEPVKAVVAARLRDPSPLKAGEEGEIIVSVANRGPGTLYRLLATSKSDFRPLDDRELAFGKIAPGETIERKMTFRVPKDALDRTDDVLWSFTSFNDRVKESIAIRNTVSALPRPRFAYGFRVDDRKGGNGDSRLQPGETATLIVDIENIGQGASINTLATLKGLSGKELFMIQGREQLKEMPPGEVRQTAFSFELKPAFSDTAARFQLGIVDVDLRVYLTEKITLPIAPPIQVQPKREVVTVTVTGDRPIPVRPEPVTTSQAIAMISNGTSIEIDGEAGDFYRARIDETHIGWIAKKATTPGETGIRRPAALLLNAPPKLTIEAHDRVVRAPSLIFRGIATDETSVRDVYIFVGDKKVFFKPNDDKQNLDPKQLAFEAEVPLENGLNYISIVAEESAELDTREIIIVRRDRPDGMSFLLPRTFSGNPEPLGVIPQAGDFALAP